ncbi:MAG: hypothetical protein AAB221_05610 [Bacteroidota bacterium]
MDSNNDAAPQPLSQQTGDDPALKKPSWFKRFARTVMILLTLSLIFIVYWFYFNKYGNGERTGILVKITHKGNFFKTDEGEMWLSCRQMTNPEKFYFSVTNDSIVQVLKNLQDECVQLTYTQYRAALPWRGDNKYIVTGVVPILKN